MMRLGIEPRFPWTIGEHSTQWAGYIYIYIYIYIIRGKIQGVGVSNMSAQYQRIFFKWIYKHCIKKLIIDNISSVKNFLD